MVNPFDKTFFKFLVGFICILVVSLAVVYIADSYRDDMGYSASVQPNQ